MANQIEVSSYGPVATVAGLLFFTTTYNILGKCVPKSATRSPFLTWKWTNIANSFIHSVLTGCGALLCFYMTPQLAEDVVDFNTSFSHLLLSFSLGYFIFDFVDMMRYNAKGRGTHELIVHHAAVSLCFTISMWTGRYIGFGIVSLLVEVNSIFLHSRQLLKLQGYPKENKVFRLNSLINIGTYVVFRIMTLAWMTRWLVLNRDKVPFVVYICGCVSVSTIVFTSTVLFFRLIISDFYRKQAKERKNGFASDQIITNLGENDKIRTNGFATNNILTNGYNDINDTKSK